MVVAIDPTSRQLYTKSKQVAEAELDQTRNDEALDYSPGHFAEFRKWVAVDKVDKITAKLYERYPDKSREIRKDYEDTITFLDRAFRFYRGEQNIEELKELYEVCSMAKGAFVVSARGKYSSEAGDFLKITKWLSPDTNEEDENDFKGLTESTPPTIMAYQDVKGDKVLIVFCPANLQDFDGLMRRYKDPDITKHASKKGHLEKFNSIISDPVGAQKGRRLREDFLYAKENLVGRLNETIAFVDRATKGKVKVIGLGAVLPALSGGGNMIDERIKNRIDITTGHRTTIATMYATYQKIMDESGFRERCIPVSVGVVGAGYIGEAVANDILKQDSSATVLLFDINAMKSSAVCEELNKRFGSTTNKRAIWVSSLGEVVDRTDIIMSAASSEVDLSDLNQSQAEKLAETAVIDDSEPGSFSPGSAIIIKPTTRISLNGDQYITNFPRHIIRYGDFVTADTYDFGLDPTGSVGPGIFPNSLFGCNAEVILAIYEIRISGGRKIPFMGKINKPSVMENYYNTLKELGKIWIYYKDLECFGQNVHGDVVKNKRRMLVRAMSRFYGKPVIVRSSLLKRLFIMEQ